MNKLWLKIIGFAVFALVAIILLYAFWPAETRTQKENKGNSEAQPNAQYEEAEKLYQTAMLHKPGSSPEQGYRIMVDCCRQILMQYPNSPQAEKAKELLQEHNITERELSLLYPSKPKVRKSRSLRRRAPRRHNERYDIPDERISVSD